LAISYRGGIGWLALVVTLRLGFLCLLFDLEESSDGETVGKTLSLQVTCLTATAAMRVWKKNLRRLPALSRGLRRHQIQPREAALEVRRVRHLVVTGAGQKPAA